jgi:quinol-cytochrome oxidoreductase complex cytochrome b subunit
MAIDTDVTVSPAAGLPQDADQLTAKLRTVALDKLPPDRLMPDRQPAYVASWIYVFGVLTVAALGVVIASGLVLAVFGPSWWHNSSTGHFVNSLHLWSVELFMFAMVVHLWGKFFMAAWRGRRRATWITGVVAFVLSVGTAFTGYLSQQNFESQWIATQAKDGINSTGAGAVFNVLNFGQMLMWHIVLLPLILIVLVGAHILLVRIRGVVPPFAETVPAAEELSLPESDGRRSTGAPSDGAPSDGAVVGAPPLNGVPS